MPAVDKCALAPQLGKADWAAVQQGPPWAVDAWGLGCLMQEAYGGQALTRTEELRNTASMPKSILPVSANPCTLMGWAIPYFLHGSLQPQIGFACLRPLLQMSALAFVQSPSCADFIM